MDLIKYFRREDELLTPDDLDIRPMTELEHFQSRTRDIVDGLDTQIAALDQQINDAIARLNDLRKIRTAQELALRFMEDKS